jgi:hypothetical protein
MNPPSVTRHVYWEQVGNPGKHSRLDLVVCRWHAIIESTYQQLEVTANRRHRVAYPPEGCHYVFFRSSRPSRRGEHILSVHIRLMRTRTYFGDAAGFADEIRER